MKNNSSFFTHHSSLDFHTHVPGAPDDGSQVAHLIGIADDVDVLGLGSQGSGLVAHGQDHGIGIDLEDLALLVLDHHTVVQNLSHTGFQMDGYLVGLEEVPEEAGVGQADAGSGDQVIQHFHDGGLFTLQIQLIGDFAASQTTADNGYILANFLLTQQEIAGLNALFKAGNGNPVGPGAGGSPAIPSP